MEHNSATLTLDALLAMLHPENVGRTFVEHFPRVPPLHQAQVLLLLASPEALHGLREKVGSSDEAQKMRNTVLGACLQGLRLHEHEPEPWNAGTRQVLLEFAGEVCSGKLDALPWLLLENALQAAHLVVLAEQIARLPPVSNHWSQQRSMTYTLNGRQV